jgi:hypothetical protein
MAYTWPENLDLTPSQKIGIGTDTPTEALEVKGKVKLEQGTAINEFSTDGNLTDNSNLAIPTEQAVKTYIDAQINQLKQTFEAKLQENQREIQSLRDHISILEQQLTNTNDNAINSINSLQNDIQNGSIIVQKAVMLQARDTDHWMRFKGVDSHNYDAYGLYRTDGQWFNLIQVGATGDLP